MPLYTTNFKKKLLTFKHIILFLICFFIIDQSLAFLLKNIYQKTNTGPGRFNYIKKHKVDCLVMGSSRSTCFYSDIISEKLGIPAMNIGLDGSALIYSRCLLDLILSNNIKPRLILLSIDLFEIQAFAWSGNFYQNIEKLAPLYGESEYIDKSLYKDKPLEFLKYQIASYKYNDLIFSLLLKLFTNNEKYKHEFSPESILQLPIDEKTLKTKFSEIVDIEKRKIELYNEMIEICKKNDIMIIFVEPPKYYPELRMTERDKKLEQIFDNIAKKNNIHFLKITQDDYPEFRSNLLFKDVLHLNNEGSKLFSNILCDKLLESIINKDDLVTMKDVKNGN